MSNPYSVEELAAECAKIRLSYMWLSEDTIKRYAEQALKINTKMDIRQLPTQVLPLNKLVPNRGQITDVPQNPRLIRDERFKQLCKSLQEDDLTGVEPCKVVPFGDLFVVLGGNMRYRALREIGAKDVSCIVVPEDTPAKVLRKIVQIDNSQFGEYDWDLIANEWDEVELADWGLELPAVGDPTSILDDADFESLNDIAREKTDLQQITFLFTKEQNEVVKAAIDKDGKQFVTDRIFELCQTLGAK